MNLMSFNASGLFYGSVTNIRLKPHQAIGISAALLTGVIFAILWLIDLPQGKLLREYVSGETPQAKVQAYVQAIARGDEETALSLWALPSLPNPEQLNALTERRDHITEKLLAAKLDPKFTVLHVEWWRTCCEPGILSDSRDAGGARIRVQLRDNKDQPFIYIFDVFCISHEKVEQCQLHKPNALGEFIGRQARAGQSLMRTVVVLDRKQVQKFQ